jgi:hypothetical protein
VLGQSGWCSAILQRRSPARVTGRVLRKIVAATPGNRYGTPTGSKAVPIPSRFQRLCAVVIVVLSSSGRRDSLAPFSNQLCLCADSIRTLSLSGRRRDFRVSGDFPRKSAVQKTGRPLTRSPAKRIASPIAQICVRFSGIRNGLLGTGSAGNEHLSSAPLPSR